MNRIYFDISATTPLDPHVAEFMHNLHKETYGNPSSIHREGQAARAVIEKTRRELALALSCNPEEIIFNSDGIMTIINLKTCEKVETNLESNNNCIRSCC